MQVKSKKFFTKLLSVFLLTGMVLLVGCEKEEDSVPTEPQTCYDISVGEVSLGDYVIVSKASLEEQATLLQKYIYNISGDTLAFSQSEPEGKYIELSLNDELTDINIEISNGYIYIQAPEKEDLTEAVYVFANTYLGYAFAGQEREWILQTADYIHIPTDVMCVDEAWMPEREPIVCLWKTNNARGLYADNNVSLKSDVLSYSDEQLYEYVKMMRHCGFTGIQVTDMCSAWAGYGGYEFVHQRLRFIADAAHSMNMKFTLWVWGAEFNGYGWVDDTVVYHNYDEYTYARECPEALATFEKYYTIYSELADCSDRVIMHFNDPGNLHDSGDIGFYTEMFRSMCHEINPDIEFGINCYTQQIDLAAVKEYVTTDIIAYSSIVHDETEMQTRRDFRQYSRDLGYGLGIWSWNLCEMEIDQIAEMNVNANLISQCYQYTRENDDMVKPNYWSEMDSYHMVNLFSLYVAGHLLQNPDLNPQVVLEECATRVVGEEYSKDLLEVLNIIEDARTGSSWSEFKLGYEDYLRTSDDYPAEELLERCNAAIPKLEAMIEASLEENSIPLAISTTDLLSLILPHLVQIRDFAQFRVDLAALEVKASNGASAEELQQALNDIYTPISEYNVVVGSWGQPEANAQYSLLSDFCKENDLEIIHDPVFDYYRKERIYGEMIAFQKKTIGCYKAPKSIVFQGGNAFGQEETARLVDLLIEDGLVLEDEDGNVYLANWESYYYR